MNASESENNADISKQPSSSTDENNAAVTNAEADTPSGLNGDKEMDIDENSIEIKKEEEEVVVKEEKIETDEASSPSRKRKFDDRDDLSDDSLSAGFLGFPDTRTEEEKKAAAAKKKQDKPKLDLLVFDSAFGKGKRSRIPNKKYESLNIKSYTKSTKLDNLDTDSGAEVTSSEDGRTDDDPESHKHEDLASSEVSSSHSSPNSRPKNRLASGLTPPTPIYKKHKISSDMSNPNYLKPFEFGWKRELVYRQTVDNNMRRNGDIYYYTPAGKKIRSMRELSENLVTKELTMEHFSFFKEPVGINDPEKEIIREAKFKGSGALSVKKSTPKSKSSKEKSASLKSSSEAAKSPRLGGFKVKIPGSSRLSQGANKNDRKRGAQGDSEMEIGMLPPVWSPKKGSTAKQSTWQAKSQPPESTTPSSKTRRTSARKSAPVVAPVQKSDTESLFMQNYLQNLSYGYQTLLYVFQYLKVQDLLRAGCVCTLWRDIAGHPSLWKTVRMKNSQVSNWEGLADALKKHRTENLDLRKMLLPNAGDDFWPLFSKAISRVDSLVRIELCRCPASVIEELAKSNTNLQVINAVTIRCENLEISAINNLENLQELRLKSTNGFVLTTDLTPLKTLTKLKHLSLTSVKDLNKQNVTIIGLLVNLESLDLGECSDFPENFGSDVIAKLTKLEKLRLEKGQGSCCTFNILKAVSEIPSLEQLELVNFDVKAGFDKALGSCTNIKKLLIIPTYISQSATTNHMVLGGVIKLKSSLSHFVWGVTLELLRVTELFVDQCEDSPNKDNKSKKPSGNGDSIPVLKPVPIMKTDEDGKEDEEEEEEKIKEPPQVEILPLPTLQKLLLNCLPTTRVKILKIPFHATWRQSIVDTVN